MNSNKCIILLQYHAIQRVPNVVDLKGNRNETKMVILLFYDRFIQRLEFIIIIWTSRVIGWFFLSSLIQILYCCIGSEHLESLNLMKLRYVEWKGDYVNEEEVVGRDGGNCERAYDRSANTIILTLAVIYLRTVLERINFH